MTVLDRPSSQLRPSGSGPFTLRIPRPGPVRSAIGAMLGDILGLRRLSGLYATVSGGPPEEFPDRALDALDTGYDVDPGFAERIPRTGPLVVVANHPLGLVDGLVLASIVLRVRKDFRFIANRVLDRIPEIAALAFFMDVLGGARRIPGNVAAVRRALRWLHEGGVLGLFPAGEVAHLGLPSLRVEEPPWASSAMALIRRSGAPVLPVRLEGANSPVFQVSGLVHPRVRTLLLGRELLRERGRSVPVSIGRMIPPAEIARMGDDAGLAKSLRARTRVLGAAVAARSSPAAGRRVEPVAPASTVRGWTNEILGLPPGRTLSAGGRFAVVHVAPGEAPELLQELGRQREIAYRSVGEGSGRPVDVDRFDAHYGQLVLWDREQDAVAGGYRFADAEAVRARRGPAGLYTSSLFHLAPGFLDRIGAGLELGRSFLAATCRRSHLPLMLLWKAIGALVAADPRRRWLFGPVTISRRYSDLSISVMVEWLSRNAADEALAAGVSPRLPPALRAGRDAGDLACAAWSLETLDSLVADIEGGPGVPVLVREYLRLGGRFLAFNQDPGFADAIDGLVVVDLLRTEGRLLDHYLGREAAAAFRRFHSDPAALPSRPRARG